MKTNKPYNFLLLALTAVFSCCSGDDYSDINTSGSNADAPLTITVTDGGYTSLSDGSSTRASEDGYKTVFTEGDKIGVFAVKNENIEDKVNNLCLIATPASNSDGNPIVTWKDDSNKAPINIHGATYYAYYPYQPDLDITQLNLSASTATEFFANVISKWTPATDQSDYRNYTAQDLMIAESTVADNALSFSMSHQMVLAVIDLPKTIRYSLASDPTYSWINTTDALDMKFNDFAPYYKDGIYRYLVKPSTDQDATLLSGSYTNGYGTTAWKVKTSSINAGKYQIFKVDGGSSSPIQKVHTLAVGDFFMKDGSLLAGSTKLTQAQQRACIGIVYCIDPNRVGKAAKQVLSNNAHGLVLALKNATDTPCRWGQYTDENSNSSDNNAPFKTNTGSLKAQYENVEGYGETKWIINEYYRPASTMLPNYYTAFYRAKIYGTKEGNTSQYAAPPNTTGWFIPSMGQWWDILSNLGEINLNNYKDNQNNSLSLPNDTAPIIDNMNRYLSRIDSAQLFFKVSNRFWSSSEADTDYACCVDFFDTGSLDLGTYLKTNSGIYHVRCSLAF